MAGIASLGWLTVDCADASAQAHFYATALGWEVTVDENPYGAVSDGTTTIEFTAVEGYQPPRWPDEHGAKQFHLDLVVDDVDEAAAALVAAGAAQPGFQPGGERWRVLTDPAGHPFCIIPRARADAG